MAPNRSLDCAVISPMRKAPGRIAACVAGTVKANDVSIRIMEVGFPPEPRLISRRCVKDESPILELPAARIEVHTFEIYDYAGVLRNGSDLVQRKGGRTHRALEASVGG